MGQQSTPIAERQVYAQDTEPEDTRDGVIWVDTSQTPRETSVYSTDSGLWENISPQIGVSEETGEFGTGGLLGPGESSTISITVPDNVMWLIRDIYPTESFATITDTPGDKVHGGTFDVTITNDSGGNANSSVGWAIDYWAVTLG